MGGGVARGLPGHTQGKPARGGGAAIGLPDHTQGKPTRGGGVAPRGFPDYTGKTSSRLDGCKQCVSWEGVGVKDGMGGEGS